MPVPRLRIHFEIALPPEEDVQNFKLGRALSASLKAAHEEMGRYWHEQVLPKHFEPGARARYGYAARGKQYRRYKFRKQGQRVWRTGPQGQRYQDLVVGGEYDDNVFTGRLRTMMQSAQTTFRAFVTRVTVTMPALPYVYRKNTHNPNRQPDKVKEIAGSFSADERINLATVFEYAFWRHWMLRLRKKRLTIDGTGRLSRIV